MTDEERLRIAEAIAWHSWQIVIRIKQLGDPDERGEKAALDVGFQMATALVGLRGVPYDLIEKHSDEMPED